MTTGIVEGKCSRGKQREKMDGLTKWLNVGRVTDELKARRPWSPALKSRALN